MARERKLSVTITADARKAQKALGDFEKSAAKSGGNAEKAINKATDALLALGAGAAIKSTIDAASNLAEAQSKVDQVFGDSADAISAWADDSARSFGMSERAALEAAGTYGNLFRAFGIGQGEAEQMSKTLVELATDLASFNNTSVEEAIDALRSGLSGETEPLKRYGVAISDVRLRQQALAMGLEVGTGALDQQTKTMAAYELVLQDTALAQGDFDRTADGLANKTRIMQAEFEDAKAELGEGLLPIMTSAVGAAADLASGFAGLEPWQQQAAVTAGAAAFAYLRWGDSIRDVASSTKRGAGNAKAYVSMISEATRDRSAGVGRTRAALNAMNDATRAGTRASVGLGSALEAIGWAGAIAGVIALGHEMSKTKVDTEKLAGATDKQLLEAIEGMETIGKATEFYSMVGERNIAVLYRMRDVLGENYDQHSELAKAIAEAEGIEKRKSETSKEYAGDLANLRGETEAVTEATVESSTALEQLAGYLDGVRDEASRAERAMRKFYDATTAGIADQIEVERGLKGLKDALAENVNNFDEVTEAGQENYEALIQSRDAAVEYAATLGNTEGAQAGVNAMEAYRLRLIDTLRDAGLTETQVYELIDQMGLTPTDIYTAFGSNAAGEEVVVQGYKGATEKVPSFWSTVFQTQTEEALREIAELREQMGTLGASSIIPGLGGASVTVVGGQHNPPRASGGAVNAGDWYKVRESGDEFFRPGVGGSIVPVGPTRNAMASGGGAAPIMVQVVLDKRVLGEVMVDVQNRRTRTDGRTPTLTTMSSVVR